MLLFEFKALVIKFGCHSLAIMDAQRERHPPKVELSGDYIFLFYRSFVAKDNNLTFEHVEISMLKLICS